MNKKQKLNIGIKYKRNMAPNDKIPNALILKCKKTGVDLKTKTGKSRSKVVLERMCAKAVKVPKSTQKTLTISTKLKKKCEKMGVKLVTPTGRPRTKATLKRMCAKQVKVPQTGKKKITIRKRCDDKDDYIECADGTICNAESGRCIKDIERNRKNKSILTVGDRVIVGSPATIAKLKNVFSSSATLPKTLTIQKKGKKKRCDDKDDYVECAEGTICNAESGKCVKDTPRNRKNRVELVVGDRIIIGSPDTIEKLKNVFPQGKSVSSSISSLPSTGEVELRCDTREDYSECWPGSVCDADTGLCTEDTADFRKNKIELMVDDRIIVGSAATIAKLKKVFPQGKIKQAVAKTLPSLPPATLNIRTSPATELSSITSTASISLPESGAEEIEIESPPKKAPERALSSLMSSSTEDKNISQMIREFEKQPSSSSSRRSISVASRRSVSEPLSDEQRDQIQQTFEKCLANL